jgi:hypothetical protein
MSAYKNLTFLLILLQLIYFSWIYGLNNSLLLKSVLIIFITLIIFNYIKNKNNLIFSFITFLFITSLGTVASEWDAQAIWLFQAKKLFYDDTFWIAQDYYFHTIGNFYHPYYPKFFQTISASIAKSFGYWNEILPKLASLLLISPPLIFISNKIKYKSQLILFLIFSLFILGRYFINAYIDGIIAIYFLTSMIILKEYLDKNTPNQIFFFTTSLFLVNNILLALKEEGLAIVFTTGVGLSFVAYYKGEIFSKKNLQILLIAFFLPIAIFFFTFKIPLNEFISAGEINKLIFDISHIKMIFNYEKFFIITSYMKYDLIICVLILFFTLNQKKFEYYKLFYICIFFYWAIIIYVYLITPYDIEWHLATSYKRISMGIKLTLFFMLSEMLSMVTKSDLKRIFIR